MIQHDRGSDIEMVERLATLPSLEVGHDPIVEKMTIVSGARFQFLNYWKMEEGYSTKRIIPFSKWLVKGVTCHL